MNQPIVPLPRQISEKSGEFLVSDDVEIIILDQEFDAASKFLRNHLRNNYRADLSVGSSYDPKSRSIRLIKSENESYPDESYRLKIDSDRIEISSSHRRGLYYGIISLIQLINGNHGMRLPGIDIFDYPASPYRGVMLDCARHFFAPGEVKSFIEALSLFKINTFHWHLTDDQGWRLPIEAYPQLREVGGWRKLDDGSLYGGFYSKEEIRDIVSFADARGIEIIPEIDMPGHCRAALASYPHLSCTDSQFEVGREWGIYDEVLCPGKETTFMFIEKVIAETAELFPGKYLHIGGDECPTIQWQDCPHCRGLMDKLKLSSYSELYNYTVSRIGRIVEKYGKIPAGWDDVCDADLPEGSLIYFWHADKSPWEVLSQGMKTVMCPTSHCYFDYYQAKQDEPQAIGGYIPLEKVYEFNPLFKNASEQDGVNIIGGQGNLWTEYMKDMKHVEYMAFPRVSALAERLWNPGGEYRDFLVRNSYANKLLRSMNINHHGWSRSRTIYPEI